MKILLTYGENSADLINYGEMDGFMGRLNNQPNLDNKMLYHDNDNSTSGNPYVVVSMPDALKIGAFKEMKSYNTICIFDDIVDLYYIGTIIRTAYVNNKVCRIEFNILPIQTNYINDISRSYDCVIVKSPNKPTYLNNIAQDIVGETVTAVNYSTAIKEQLRDFQAIPRIMLVINKDLSPLGIANKSHGAIIPSGEIIIENPLPACATKVAGTTVGGFVLFFDNQAGLQKFIDSCYKSDVKVRSNIYAEDNKTFQAPKSPYPMWGGGTFPPVARTTDLNETALVMGVGIVDGDKVDSVYIPESITPSSFIMCREVPYQLVDAEEPVEVAVKLPIVINSEPYFNLSSLLQVKCVSSSGQAMVLDGHNILFNDGTVESGFNCRMVASLSGIDLYIGESSYTLNLCKFPEVSYTGNAFENYSNVNNRSGIISKFSSVAGNFLSTVTDKLWTATTSDFQTTQSPSTRTYELIGLDKTSVVGSVNASAWTSATFHVETTYLPSGVKSRLNAVYERFGYDDYAFKTLDINAIPPGFWQAGRVQEVNPTNLTKITYINSDQSDAIKAQLLGGVYVKV